MAISKHGHDDISAKMLKETALSITPAVTELFNISIRLGELSDEWKVSRVSPIPKQTSIQTLEATVQYHCYQF